MGRKADHDSQASHTLFEQSEGWRREDDLFNSRRWCPNARGRDVLLFDLDPQGTITRGLGYGEYYTDMQQEVTLHEVLLEREPLKHVDAVIESNEISPRKDSMW